MSTSDGFDNVKIMGHEPNSHLMTLSSSFNSPFKDTKTGNDHIVIPEVYKCSANASFLPHMNHVRVSPTDGNGPTQGQRKTLTRVEKRACFSHL